MALQKVLNLYKKSGETPLERIDRFRSKNPEYAEIPMTYAGRLDPAAEGVLVVLSGDECKRKGEYLKLRKGYEGQILFGFRTDTLDLLGVPASSHFQTSKNLKIDAETLERVSKEVVGKQVQKYPRYSSRTVEGKPLWQWTREGADVPRPEREVEVYSFEVLNISDEAAEEILGNVRDIAGKVQGDFRQKEIVSEWSRVLFGVGNEKFPLVKFRTEVSSGTYVRSMASDVGESLGSGAILYSLKRFSVGDYKIEDSVR